MKKYLLLPLFLVMFVASPALADGRGKGRGHHGHGGYKHVHKVEKKVFKKIHRHRPHGVVVHHHHYRAYPVYPVVPVVPAYGYYPACPYPPPPPPPVYGHGPAVRGHVGIDIVF